MGALKNMNRKAEDIVDNKFKNLLLKGNWPEVQYRKHSCGSSFNLIEYSTVRSRFVKSVHDRLVKKGIEYGLWQNARNKNYLDAVKDIVDRLTPDQVNNSDRFKTIWG